MAFHWTFRSLPELNHLSERERHHVLRNCIGIRTYLRLAFSSLLCALFLTIVVITVFQAFAPHMDERTLLICASPAAIAGFIFFYQFYMRTTRSLMRLTILHGFRGKRLPFCLFCGYDLNSIKGDVCPECGKGIHVRPDLPGSSEANDGD